MASHEEIREQIPAYAASRLEPDAVCRLEEHLAGCDACRELAATAAGIAGAIREGGEALFEPHPRELALRAFAGGTSTSDERARIERHLPYCATCRLEVEAWKSTTGARTGAGRSRWLVPSLTAAAGLILGAVLVLSVRDVPKRPPPVEPTERWGGDSPLYVLPGMVRGSEGMSVPTWSLGNGDSHLSIGVQPVLPAEIADGAIYRLELRRNDGSTAWSVEMTAGRMREHLRTPAEVVHVTLPVANLTPGSYEFRITATATPPAPPIYSARVEIAAAR